MTPPAPIQTVMLNNSRGQPIGRVDPTSGAIYSMKSRRLLLGPRWAKLRAAADEQGIKVSPQTEREEARAATQRDAGPGAPRR